MCLWWLADEQGNRVAKGHDGLYKNIYIKQAISNMNKT